MVWAYPRLERFGCAVVLAGLGNVEAGIVR